MGLEINVKRTDLLDLEFLKKSDVLDVENKGKELICLIYGNGLCTIKELDGDIYEIVYKIENGVVYINQPQIKLKISEDDKISFYYSKHLLINAGLID